MFSYLALLICCTKLQVILINVVMPFVRVDGLVYLRCIASLDDVPVPLSFIEFFKN